MTAYVISEVVGLDSGLVAQYRAIARATIEHYGGEYLSNVGNQIDKVEGERSPANIVLLRFPSMARTREWYQLPGYAEALAVRRTALRRSLIFVAGADES